MPTLYRRCNELYRRSFAFKFCFFAGRAFEMDKKSIGGKSMENEAFCKKAFIYNVSESAKIAYFASQFLRKFSFFLLSKSAL